MLSAASGPILNGVAIDGSYDPNKAIPVLRDLGAKSVRIWHSADMTQTGRLFWDDELVRIKQYADAGFDVVLLVTPKEGDRRIPSYDQTKSHFRAILSEHPQLKGQVDGWEIVNEPNVPKYFGGGYNGTANLAKYVSNVLKPAYEVLSAVGETVIGGGLTSANHAAGVAELKRAGYDRYVDIGNLHPYWSDANGVRDRIEEMERAFPGLPLTSTEWNITSARNDADWARKMDEVHEVLDDKLVSHYYFRLGYKTSSAIHKAGLVYTLNTGSYTPHHPFYNTFKGWSNGQRSVPDVQPAAPRPVLTPSGTTRPTPSRPAPARPTPQPAPARPTPAPARPSSPSNPGPARTNAFATIQAEDADVLRGLGVTTKGGAKVAAYFTRGDYLKFDDVDFGTGARGVEFRVASPYKTGTLEVRLGSPTGRLVGKVDPGTTGGWDRYKTFTGSVAGATGVQDVYIVGKAQYGGAMPNLDWLKFKK